MPGNRQYQRGLASGKSITGQACTSEGGWIFRPREAKARLLLKSTEHKLFVVIEHLCHAIRTLHRAGKIGEYHALDIDSLVF